MGFGLEIRNSSNLLQIGPQYIPYQLVNTLPYLTTKDQVLTLNIVNPPNLDAYVFSAGEYELYLSLPDSSSSGCKLNIKPRQDSNVTVYTFSSTEKNYTNRVGIELFDDRGAKIFNSNAELMLLKDSLDHPHHNSDYVDRTKNQGYSEYSSQLITDYKSAIIFKDLVQLVYSSTASGQGFSTAWTTFKRPLLKVANNSITLGYYLAQGASNLNPSIGKTVYNTFSFSCSLINIL